MHSRLQRRHLQLALGALLIASAFVLITPAPASAIDGCGINPFCVGSKVIGGAVSSVASDAITALAKAVLGALGKAVEWASTLWVGVGTPQLADASGRPSGSVAFLQHNLLYYATGLAVLSVLIGAGRIVYQEHKAAQARELARFLATYVLVSAAAAFAASVLVGGCDEMANWFIGQATANTSFANHLANLLGLGTAATSGATGSAAAGFTVGLAGTAATAVIAIVLGLIAFLASVIQIVLMLVRGGMLVLLVGTLPLIAAWSNTEMGMQWFRKASAWLLAFALYKPAAAIIYAVAFTLAGQQGALALLDGVMMLLLAILALPALMRFLVPATSVVAGGGAGGMLAGVAGGAGMLAMRMPTGAAPVQATPAATAYGQGHARGPTGASGSGGPGGALGGPGGGTGSNGSGGSSGSRGSGGGSGMDAQGSASGAVAVPGATSGSAAGGGAGGAGGAAGGSSGAGAAGGTASVWATQQVVKGANKASKDGMEPAGDGGGGGGPSGSGGASS
jgi:type IV secretion system protein TrbL